MSGFEIYFQLLLFIEILERITIGKPFCSETVVQLTENIHRSVGVCFLGRHLNFNGIIVAVVSYLPSLQESYCRWKLLECILLKLHGYFQRFVQYNVVTGM